MSGWGNSEPSSQSNQDWSQGNVSNDSYSNNQPSPRDDYSERPPRSSGDNRNNGPSNYGNSYENSDRPARAPPSNYKWASSKRRYEWKDSFEEDGIAPRDEELEKELFGEDNHVHTGLNFDKYESIPTSVRGDNPPNPVDKVHSICILSLLATEIQCI